MIISIKDSIISIKDSIISIKDNLIRTKRKPNQDKNLYNTKYIQKDLQKEDPIRKDNLINGYSSYHVMKGAQVGIKHYVTNGVGYIPKTDIVS